MCIRDSPEITAEAKVESIETIFGPKDQREASLSVGMRGLLAILIRKGRISALMPVLEEYGRLVMEFRREVQAHVRTAAALSEDEEQRIQEALCQSLHKKVSLSVEAVSYTHLHLFFAGMGIGFPWVRYKGLWPA